VAALFLLLLPKKLEEGEKEKGKTSEGKRGKEDGIESKLPLFFF